MKIEKIKQRKAHLDSCNHSLYFGLYEEIPDILLCDKCEQYRAVARIELKNSVIILE